MSRIKGQQHLSSLTVSSVFTRERSVQLLTQLCVIKPKKKQTNKQTRKITYGVVTGWLYWSIRELTVILPPRTMYDWWNKRGGRPHHLGNISYSFSTIVPVSCFTTLYQTSPKFVNIHEFREGISVKFRSIYCRRNFAQWDEMGRKFGSKRRVSTIRPLLMNY